jgi:PAS domain S-box-containing protein
MSSTFRRVVNLAILLSFMTLAAFAVLSYRNTSVLIETLRKVAQTEEVLATLERVISHVKDAETGQRGYLITSDERYLEPYEFGVIGCRDSLFQLRQLFQGNQDQQRRLDLLETIVKTRLERIRETLDVVNSAPGEDGFELAREHILTDRGKKVMDQLRDVAAELSGEQRRLLAQREETAEREARTAHRALLLGNALILGMIALAGYSLRLERQKRDTAEASLSENQARLASIVDSAMDAIISIDDRQTVVLYNPAAERIFGWPGAAVIGQPLAQLLPPTIRPLHTDLVRHFGENDLPNQLIGVEEPVIGVRASGEAFPLEASISKTRVDGQPLYHVILRDVTERTRARARLRQQTALLDQVRDSILICDLEDRVLFWNAGAVKLYGWTAAEAIGRTTLDLCGQELVDREQPPSPQARAAGSWIGELRHHTRDGREIIVESRWTLVPGDTGQYGSWVVINIDVTDRKRREAVRLRNQRLESIGTLAGGVAHDLNNVLTPVIMGVKLLLKNRPGIDRQSLLETMHTSAIRGAEMVKQLLAFAGGATGLREPVSIAAIIEEVRGILSHTLPKTISIEVECPPTLATVSGDPTELAQVLMNLCINARDAMSQGGKLYIAARDSFVAQGKNGDGTSNRRVLIEISDTGCGIPAEIRDQVFDPFFTTKEAGKGTGLGLSTSMGIVAAHGGTISLESQVGQGTCFTIELPALLPPVEHPEKTSEQDSLTGENDLILLVDDEPLVLQTTRITLESHAYRVVVAHDGAEALNVLAQFGREVRAIVLDMMMPGMDGAATLPVLNQRYAEIPVIAVSGLRPSGEVADLVRQHAATFLRKPYNDDQLLQALARLLHASRAAPTL